MLANTTYSKISFNSTLVQLKDTIPLQLCCFYTCFNSTLVQLKVNIRVVFLGGNLLFQFYLSSIKSK